jgi:hypothetical protein
MHPDVQAVVAAVRERLPNAVVVERDMGHQIGLTVRYLHHGREWRRGILIGYEDGSVKTLSDVPDIVRFLTPEASPTGPAEEQAR